MTATTKPDIAPQRVAFAVLLRGALPPTVVVGLVAALVVGLVGGPRAGVSGLVGAVIAVVFFASGLLVVSRFVTDTGNALLFMAVGMSVYLAQVILLFGVLLLARAVEVFDSRSAGIVLLLSIVTWQVAQMRAWRRARVPVYDEAPARAGAEGSTDAPPDARVDPLTDLPTLPTHPTAPVEETR